MEKRASFILILSLLALNPLTLAWADPDRDALEAQARAQGFTWELEERMLEPAQTEHSDKMIIRIKDQVFELDRVPDREAILARGGIIENVDPLQPYDSLSEDNKQKFQEMRLIFLTNTARILNATKFVFGAGSLAGDAFSFIKIKTAQVFGKEVEPIEKIRRSFNERSRQSVQSILRGIDYKLWSQAPLVIDSNEYGLSISAGILAESGILRHGGGGAEEIGLSLAFNKKSKAFVFEIFHNSEKFDNTKAAISVLGVVGKVGMTLIRRDGAQTLNGASFYPPAIPAYSASSPEYFTAGMSSSLGLPLPPLADLLTFTNTFERNTLIRITVSPVVKGFVRIQFGDLAGSVRLVAMRFVDVYSAISDKVFKIGRRSCGLVFN